MHPAIYALKELVCEEDGIKRLARLEEWVKDWAPTLNVTGYIDSTSIIAYRGPVKDIVTNCQRTMLQSMLQVLVESGVMEMRTLDLAPNHPVCPRGVEVGLRLRALRREPRASTDNILLPTSKLQ